jgi:repressor LexA
LIAARRSADRPPEALLRAFSPTVPHAMSSRLTERQNQVYEYLRSYVRDNGRPPTIKEIGAELAIRSTNGVHKLLVVLEQKGFVARTPHEARGLRLLGEETALQFDDGPPSLFGPRSSIRSDSARRPLPRARQPIIVDPRLLGPGVEFDDCLAVTAGDDGMNGEGIRKNDLLVVEEMDWQTLHPDTLVAAYVEDRLLIRRYAFGDGLLHLRAADRTYKDESFPLGSVDVYVIGRVLALMRRL